MYKDLQCEHCKKNLFKMNYITLCLVLLCTFLSSCKSDLQLGPDPWNYKSDEFIPNNNEKDLPPDLRTPLKKERTEVTQLGYGEFWFRRILTVVLKSGQVKKNDDDSIDVALQMRFEADKWRELEENIKSKDSLMDSVFRQSVGYVEDAIYKPTIIDQIKTTWSEYIQLYLTEYKTEITWSFAVVAASVATIWLWRHMSHKHVILIVFCFLYAYEVIISYKEAEKQELEKFVSAVNTCKWYFWTTECAVPPPDPLVFMRHMNPMKIGIRMATSFIFEPVLALNSIIQVSAQNMTDGLWYPFNKIASIIILVIINISLLYLLVMVFLNLVFNIPFKFSTFGIARIEVKERTTSLLNNNSSPQPQQIQDGDRLSGDRLDRLLNAFNLALCNRQNGPILNNNNEHVPKLTRSASAGRLPFERLSQRRNDQITSSTVVRKRNVAFNIGSGDHL